MKEPGRGWKSEVGAFPHVVRTEPTPPGVGPTTALSARLDSLFCFFTTLPHIYASIMLGIVVKKQDHTMYGLAESLVETEGLEPATSRM